MIMFVGQIAREMREREAFQELDYRAVFGTMAKWTTEIDDPARIPEIVSRAFYTATNGRPGPVVIALPEDMLTERVGRAECAAVRAGRDLARPHRHVAAAEDAVGARSGRSRIVGGSRWSEKACAAMQRFAERFAAAGDQPRSGAGICSIRRIRVTPAISASVRTRKLLARIKAADRRDPGRRAHGRNAEPELYAVRYSRHRGRPSCMCIPARKSSAASIVRIWRSMHRRPRLPRRSKACRRRTTIPLGGGNQDRACRLSRLHREADRRCPARQSRRDHGVAARAASNPTTSSATAPAISPAWLHRFYRFRKFDTLLRPDLGLDGLRRAGRGRDEAALSRAHCVLPCRRRRLPDERAGIRDRRAIRTADHHRDRRTTECTAPSACIRSANIPAAWSRPR